MKNLLIILLLLFSASLVHAQTYDYVQEDSTEKVQVEPPIIEEETNDDDDEGDPVPFSDRVYFGGNLGFQFGQIRFFDVSPLMGYMLTDRFSVGLGVTYQYFQDRRFSNNYSSNILGGRIFSRYMVTNVVFPQVEYESLSIQFRDSFGAELERQWFSSLLAGVGLAQPIGQRGAINVLILYNLSYDSNQQSLYNSPWVTRVGFIF